MINQSSNEKQNPFFDIAISLLLGACIGFLTTAFIKVLQSINEAQVALNLSEPFHLLIIPPALALIYYIKRNTLFFPVKIEQLVNEKSSDYWSWAMLPIHFIGTVVGHAAGLSLGREGAAVLFSAGFVRVFRLSWRHWGAVAASIGFASILGQYWIAPIFLWELFGPTRLTQKTYALLGSMVAVLIGQYFQVPHLFLEFQAEDTLGFFTKFIFLFGFAFLMGYIMRFYKKTHRTLGDYFFKSHFALRLLTAVLLMAVLYYPEARKYQSLGLLQFSDLMHFEGSLVSAFVKLLLTLVSTSLGYLGGEFIPLVYAGTHLGAVFFSYFGHSLQLGGAFGAFVLFAAGTRLKWTSYFLLLSLLGFSWWFWAYFVMAVAVAFSGPESLYKKASEDDL